MRGIKILALRKNNTDGERHKAVQSNRLIPSLPSVHTGLIEYNTNKQRHNILLIFCSLYFCITA